MVDTQALIVLTGLIVTVMWCTTILAGVVSHDYQGMEISTPVMVIYAGFIFGRGSLAKKGDTKQ